MKKRSLWILVLVLSFFGLIVIGCEPCDVTKPCVVMLGDSIFALTDKESMFLERLSGDTYRKYYVSGAQMVGGFMKNILRQYDEAIADGPIRTVILDGGGNDILIGANRICSADYGGELSDECYQVMDNVLAEAENRFREMVADGVENVVYQGYYYVRNQKLWQVTDVFQEKGILLVEALAAEFPDVTIIYVDPRPHFKQGDTSHLLIDGIHPSRTASKTLANLLWGAMVENDIEQGEPCDQ
jgi:lysophospholipase L1-like esterase